MHEYMRLYVYIYIHVLYFIYIIFHMYIIYIYIYRLYSYINTFESSSLWSPGRGPDACRWLVGLLPRARRATRRRKTPTSAFFERVQLGVFHIMGMYQNLYCDIIFGKMNIHESQLFLGKDARVLTHSHKITGGDGLWFLPTNWNMELPRFPGNWFVADVPYRFWFTGE